VARCAAPTEGLLTQFVARTDDGVLLLNVSESGQAGSAWHHNQLHREAVLASRMPTLVQERFVREYVADQVELFHKQRDDRSDLAD
jgi:hypothetical protein